MRHAFSLIIIAAIFIGTAHLPGPDSMSMSHAHGGDMQCSGSTCATAPAPQTPDQNCIEHCLRSAFAGAPAASQAATYSILILLVAMLTSRMVFPELRPDGAPPHLASFMRLRILSTVVMRN